MIFRDKMFDFLMVLVPLVLLFLQDAPPGC